MTEDKNKPEPASKPTPAKGRKHTIARGLCLFVGLFALLNVIICVKGGTAAQNMNVWWIDLNSLLITYQGASIHLGFIVEAIGGAAMILWAIKPHCSLARRIVTAVLTAGLAVVAFLNAITYWQTLASGTLYHALPVPLSFVIAVALAAVTWIVARSKVPAKEHPGFKALVVVFAAVFALVFPLCQITFFGTTDYRRDADAAVVFGARVYENGSLSLALRERMETAVELYEEGYVDKLIVSGGIEEGGVDEAQAMYNYAVSAGVPSSALLIDRYGDSTELSVKNTIKLAENYGLSKIIATSRFYHMPRIKMLYNLSNIDVLTVPTVGDVLGNGTIASLPREIPAWWYYWVKGSLS